MLHIHTDDNCDFANTYTCPGERYCHASYLADNESCGHMGCTNAECDGHPTCASVECEHLSPADLNRITHQIAVGS